jgi:FKBP-type peptidyl-prolyl cis-trans isomerase
MRKLTALPCIVLSLFLLAACEAGYKQMESGLQYKVVESGSGAVAAAGSTVKLHYEQVLHDTVVGSTFGKLPYYKALIPGTIFPYDPFEVLTKGVRAGDSIVVIQRMDSLLKKGKLDKLPPHLKPEDVMIIRIRILKVFPFEIMRAGYVDSLVNADKETERRTMDSVQSVLGPKRVEEYLRKKNIVASINTTGTYVEVIGAGEGPQADSGRKVSLKYTVSSLQGKVLDTNMDTSFQKNGLLSFVMGTGYMLPSVEYAIGTIKKGGHIKVYIPAMVASREMRRTDAYDDIIFEVILEDVQQ